jgi:hypothetical protein
MSFDSTGWAFAFANIIVPLTLLALGYGAKRWSEFHDRDVKK